MRIIFAISPRPDRHIITRSALDLILENASILSVCPEIWTTRTDPPGCELK
jgi:hypothetical protein